MKRTVLVLAAAFLGTGCIVVDDEPDCVGTVSVEWDFERWDASVPTGSISQICAAADVAYVDVWMNDALVDTFFCTDGGVMVTGVLPGSYLFTVEGLDLDFAIRYRHEFQVDASRCGDPLFHARPSQGTVAIDYSFTPTNACYSDSTRMSLQVRDEVAGDVAFLEPPTTGPTCSTTAAAPSYILPTGAFTLQWIQEMLAGGGGGFTVVGRDCADYPFTVPAAGSATVFPALADASAACP